MFAEKDYVRYQELSKSEVDDIISWLISCWVDFVNQNAPGLKSNEDYYIHEKNIYEVIRRTDKRKVYYAVFHNLKEISELKHIAILCYWINTLKPFMVINEKCDIYSSPNEMFSVFLILSTIRGLYEDTYGSNKDFIYPSENRIADIVYDFKYCDLSREAMISFVETFADNYGVGIEYIFKNKLK